MPSEAELLAFFEAADKDGSGELTAKELAKVLINDMKLDVTVDEVAAMFKDLDADSDKKVTKAEYLSAMGKVPAKKMDKAELKRKFQALDKSGDGKLDANEIRAMISSQNKSWSEKGLNEVLAQIDTSGDGKVDYNEFCDLLFQ